MQQEDDDDEEENDGYDSGGSPLESIDADLREHSFSTSAASNANHQHINMVADSNRRTFNSGGLAGHGSTGAFRR